MKRIPTTILVCALIGGLQIGCGSSKSGGSDGTSSDIAVSAVSGALNNNSNLSLVGWNLPIERKSIILRAVELLKPISTALAATWTCTGGTLTPTFAGTGDYTFKPKSCSITWANDKTATSAWSGNFLLSYDASCTGQDASMEDQLAACKLTLTTAIGGNTRTLTGPDDNTYAITHDTNGAGTGWDGSVVPAANSKGVVIGCGTNGCAVTKKLTINGSHLTGTLTPAGGQAREWWDHTVTTGTDGISVRGTGTSRVVTGAVTVQHNLAKFTGTTSFNTVGYGQTVDGTHCCFPTSGNVTTTFTHGPYAGRTEILTFSTTCGEATLTSSDGNTSAYTLLHCI